MQHPDMTQARPALYSPDARSEPIIRVERLTAGYGETTILENVSMEIRQGEIFIILGGSGCGKSTLLKHMIGLLEPRSGRVVIDGDDLTHATGRARRAILRKFGVAFQSGALFGSMTVLENVRLPLEQFTRLSRPAMNLIAMMKLRLVGLAEAADLTPAELSGGMIKRAAIARAMAMDPRIVFLDEPSAGLDPISSAELDQLIVFLARSLGITFVIVTHELASIDAIADRVVMLDRRKRGILAEGKPAELREHSPDPFVHRFFNRLAEP